jgi:hypothetical protein
MLRFGHPTKLFVPRECESMSRAMAAIVINQTPPESMQSEHRSMLDPE